jgi:ATP-dependent DNA ligase
MPRLRPTFEAKLLVTAEAMKQIQWLRPKLVTQIEFTEWTTGNHLRQSRFVALRDDKAAREVKEEML